VSSLINSKPTTRLYTENNLFINFRNKNKVKAAEIDVHLMCYLLICFIEKITGDS
jgi:hypothetical protein